MTNTFGALQSPTTKPQKGTDAFFTSLFQTVLPVVPVRSPGLLYEKCGCPLSPFLLDGMAGRCHRFKTNS
jgi:hypothetical protein